MLRSSWLSRTIGGVVPARLVTQRRCILTLAIETSADDTAVAVIETQSTNKDEPIAHVHFHEKITADNSAYKGIEPRNSAISHQTELPGLINRTLRQLPVAKKNDGHSISFAGCGKPHRKPDFIAATRGPGMRGGLSTGLDMAKGLCLAYDIPFLGVHHMQAHALTPRLVSALTTKPGERITPEFPYRSLLVSGGHTLLVNGESLIDFEKEVETLDTAAGHCVDKMAKFILPPEMIDQHKTDTNYGAALETFAFPNGEADYKYRPPKTREDLLTPQKSTYQWAVPPPLQASAQKEFSFCGLDSSIRRIVLEGSAKTSDTRKKPRDSPMEWDERVQLARHAQRVMFEHIADRVHMAIRPISPYVRSIGHKNRLSFGHDISDSSEPCRLVVSGGVASNKFFRHVLWAILESRGVKVELFFPPVSLCTDNAMMIAWAGIEMWQAGWHSTMNCTAENRWPLAGENGLIGMGGWQRRS